MSENAIKVLSWKLISIADLVHQHWMNLLKAVQYQKGISMNETQLQIH